MSGIGFSFGSTFDPSSIDTSGLDASGFVPSVSDLLSGAGVSDIAAQTPDTSSLLSDLVPIAPDYNSVTSAAGAPSSSATSSDFNLSDTLGLVSGLAKTGLQTYATVQAINKSPPGTYAYQLPTEPIAGQQPAAPTAADMTGSAAPATSFTLASLIDPSTPYPWLLGGGAVLLLLMASNKKVGKR